MDKNQFRKLPLFKKCFYLLDNYLWDAVLAVALVLTFCSWIQTDFLEPKPVLSIEMIDGSHLEGEDQAFHDFLTYKGIASEDRLIRLNNRIQVSNHPTQLKCNADAMIMCVMLSERTDLYFWNQDSTDNWLIGRDLVDLREVLPANVIEDLEGRLVYNRPAVEGGYPCGIDMTGSQWLQEHGFYDECVVGISRHAPEAETAGEFLAFII